MSSVLTKTKQGEKMNIECPNCLSKMTQVDFPYPDLSNKKQEIIVSCNLCRGEWSFIFDMTLVARKEIVSPEAVGVLEAVFVYGTLRNDGWNHGYLHGSTFLKKGETKDKYAMYSSSIPFVANTDAVSTIKGEVYQVNKLCLNLLDRLENHPSWYCREKTLIVAEDGTEIEAWLYFNNSAPPGSKLVEDGDYIKHINSTEHADTEESSLECPYCGCLCMYSGTNAGVDEFYCSECDKTLIEEDFTNSEDILLLECSFCDEVFKSYALADDLSLVVGDTCPYCHNGLLTERI